MLADFANFWQVAYVLIDWCLIFFVILFLYLLKNYFYQHVTIVLPYVMTFWFSPNPFFGARSCEAKFDIAGLSSTRSGSRRSGWWGRSAARPSRRWWRNTAALALTFWSIAQNDSMINVSMSFLMNCSAISEKGGRHLQLLCKISGNLQQNSISLSDPQISVKLWARIRAFSLDQYLFVAHSWSVLMFGYSLYLNGSNCRFFRFGTEVFPSSQSFLVAAVVFSW